MTVFYSGGTLPDAISASFEDISALTQALQVTFDHTLLLTENYIILLQNSLSKRKVSLLLESSNKCHLLNPLIDSRIARQQIS